MRRQEGKGWERLKEKPILFSTPMVQAILEGRKIQTRRVIRFPEGMTGRLPDNGFVEGEEPYLFYPGGIKRPSYQTGDVLWVRETWNGDWCDHVIYRADGGSAKAAGYSAEPKWKPAIHMPRVAARIFLRVTDVRVERVQEISEDDAEAEGAYRAYPYVDSDGKQAYARDDRATHIGGLSAIWDSLNAKRGYGWDKNPFVWVYTFKRINTEVE